MASVLSNLSDDLAAIVSEAGTGVVRVEARRRRPASGVVWSADGTIVTAHHVVEQEDDIRVGLPDGQTASARLVGRDPATDLSVLRADASGLTPPPWGETEGVRVGHLVLALGRPGQSVRTALGIISSVGGDWVTPAGGRVDRYLQTDVVMYPGFSGGPLVDASSHVLGINTSSVRRGITITLPSATVRQTVEALLAHGRIRRGYLGVGTQPVRLPAGLAEQLKQDTGLLLVHVAPDSPAEGAGLLLGDVLTAVDGQLVPSVGQLLTLLSGATVGSALPMRIVRGGNALEVTVTVGEHP